MLLPGEKKPILFVLSVDTEEEWDWSTPFPQSDFSLHNINELTNFQAFCENLGIKPTYFVDYAVADNEAASAKIKEILQGGNCELGAHLHPWCNPPYFGNTGEKESHVIMLPKQQVEQKFISLMSRLENQFNVTPRSFRTGRWGIDAKTLKIIIDKGLEVDSSIYPFYKNNYFSCHGSPLLPYRPDLSNPLNKSTTQHNFVEFPVTVGFNHKNFRLCERIYNTLAHPRIRQLHLVGLAWRTHILRKIYLSPELSSARDMLKLCRVSLANNYPVLHMFMHSSGLIDNNNSHFGKQQAYSHITQSISYIITELKKEANIQFCTISEASNILKQKK